MTQIKATANPIVVDKEVATNGSTTIEYEKEESDELWERNSFPISSPPYQVMGNWNGPINLFARVQTAEAATKGKFPVNLKPGQTYEVGIFTAGHGPLRDPIRKSYLKVFCVWKKPEDRQLITDENRAFGGTWYWHQVHTKIPTDIISIGVSRIKPTIDSNGIPHLQSPDGAPTAPLAVTNDHQVEIKPLLAGNHYFFVVVVTDAFGNWEVKQDEFTTFRRKLTVQFPTVHIFNDGDPEHGEGEFWFRVYFGGPRGNQNPIQEFHLPTQDIDDWSETDRPYPVGFAHVGLLEVVNPGQETVSVGSWGREHDNLPFEGDEDARSRDKELGFPVGQGKETVTNSMLTLDCINVNNTNFHYGVDVVWSVAYEP
jgi:hypothetical protein